jgi:Flp pilus assembly protein TadD
MTVLEGERSENCHAPETRVPAAGRELASWHRCAAAELIREGRFAESEIHLREASRLSPDDVRILNDLGTALWRQNRPAEAEAIFRQAWQIDGNDYATLTNLGLALHIQRRLGEAAQFYRTAIAIQPDGFEANMALGVVLSDEGEFDEAMARLVAAHQLKSDSADGLQNLGMNLGRLGRWHDAIVMYEAALRINPESPEVHKNLAYALLAIGDYERGWAEHEWRFKCADYAGRRVNRTFWNGDDFHGRTILLHAEQGLGDTLQFIRFAPMVKRRGGTVVVLCPASLLRLAARCEGVDLAVDASSFVPDCDVHAPMLSLPSIFGTTMATVPTQVPYLATDDLLVEHWRCELSRALGIENDRGRCSHRGTIRRRVDRPFLIGIAWQGNPEHPGDRWRSFPLAHFAQLADVPHVRLVSLQAEHGLDQLGALGGQFPIAELTGPRRSDFTVTAAIMAHLDLVITPDTAVAHLAGGLGLPVWVAVCAVSDWRWPSGRDDTPWYPTMRLFRQSRLGDWDGVFRRMSCALEQAQESRN